jgi:hypothetical protein
MRYSLFLKTIVCLLAMGFKPILAGAQSYTKSELRKIDSLNRHIANPSHDTILGSAYVQLSSILGVFDWDTLFVMSNKAVAVAEKGLARHSSGLEHRAFKLILSKALNNLGYVANYKGEIEKALAYNKRSLEIAKQLGDKRGMASAYINIGSIQYDMGDIPSALEQFTKSAQLAEQVNDLQGMAYAYNNLGSINSQQNDHKAALHYFGKSMVLSKKMDDRHAMAMINDNIAEIKMHNPVDTTAKGYYLMAMKLRQELGDKEGIALSYSNLSKVYRSNDNLPMALTYLNNALSIQEEIGDMQGIAMTCVNIAGINLEMEPTHLDQAHYYANRSLNLAKDLGDPHEMMDAANILSQVMKARGNYKKALEFYTLHVTMRDSIYNEENRRTVMQQQFQYQYDKKETLLTAEQEKKDAIASEQLRKREIYLAAAAAITFLLGLMSLMAFFAYRSKSKINSILERKNHLIEAQKKEITDSIRYAENIQRALLPHADVLQAVFPDSFLFHRPKDIVSGDFYWIYDFPDRVYFAVVDCTGHGVPGAFMSFIGTSALNRAITDLGLVTPSDILSSLSDQVSETLRSGQGADVKDGMDLALCCYFKQTGELHYAGAYNPLWVMRNGEMEIIRADKQPVGNMSSHSPFTNHILNVSSGDAVYLFSDGFADQFGGAHDKRIGSAKFRSTLLAMRTKSLKEQGIALAAYFDAWKGTA